MKINSIILFAGLLFSIFIGCQKQNEITVVVPVVTISAVTDITATTAVSGGVVKSDGGAPVFSRGVCWSTKPNPTMSDSLTYNGSGTNSFASLLKGLTPVTTYYVRAYAANAAGANYSSQETFTTLASSPVLTTAPVLVVTSTSASSGGNITNDGGSAVTARGVVWGTNTAPTTADSKTNDGTGTGSFTSTINGLAGHTIYYLRAYATNNIGTVYGNEFSFQTLGAGGAIIFNPTLNYGSVTDIDGNVYKTIQIGTQTWMAENLKTTKYRNGDPITYLTDYATWNILNLGAYFWFNNDITNKGTYGALYNWYAATDSRNIAPAGWHVPTYDELTTLINYLGGTLAAGKIKETGTNHWPSPNTGTNETGFTALPGGIRDGNSFIGIEQTGYWWTTSGNPFSYVWDLYISFSGYLFAV